jgi:hypothetical protein
MKSATEFIRFWLSEEVHGVPPLIQNAYVEMVQWFSQNPHTKGFDEKSIRPDLDDASPFGVAKQFFWYFETHFFKAQNSLILAGLESQQHHNASWLDQPYLCILDIGCGSGAATCALLDILVHYHIFRKQLGLPVHKTHLSIGGIDPGQFAIETYSKFLTILSPLLERESIHIMVTPINDEFPHPECVEKVINGWKPIYPYTLLGISSNLIRPLQNQWERMHSYLKAAGITQEFNLGEVAAKAYDKMINEFGFEQVIILDIATRNRLREGFTLFSALKGFWTLIRKFLGQQSKFQWWSTEEEQTVSFYNSPNSYHGRYSSDKEVVQPVYLNEINIGRCNESFCDELWRKVAGVENLILAWVRARNYILHDDLVDEVEIKLFDANWEEYLLRLRLCLDAGDLSILNCDNLIYFPYPKNEREDRPKYGLSITEQLTCAATSQSFPDSFQPVDNNLIFGNKLNLEKNEFFYEPWFGHHKSYSSAIRNAATHGKYVCKTDIKSFYVNIKQNDLYRLLIKALNGDNSTRIKAVLRSTILRQLASPPHSPNFGLPQSGITAGLWSSKYLSDADEEILSELDVEAQYFRYADDISFIHTANEIESTLNMIEERFNNLGLVLNPGKTTKPVEAVEYIRKAKDDPGLRNTSIGVGKVLNSLYFLPREFRKQYLQDRDCFLKVYAGLLSGIGIHLSADWLNRKILARLTPLHRLWHSAAGTKVNFPAFPKSEKEKEYWLDEFEIQNPHWMGQRDNLISELVNSFNEAFEQITESSKQDETIFAKSRRALRFSVYRLAIFGVTPIVDALKTLLIDKPYLLLSKIVLRSLVDAECADVVIELATEWNKRSIPGSSGEYNLECASYLCASACWALGYSAANQDIINLLYAVLESDQSTLHERLLASEALIRLDRSFPERYELVLSLLRKGVPARLQKNLVMLCYLNNPEDFYQAIPQILPNTRSTVVHDAILYLLAKKDNILALNEPRIIENYYARWYPDIPAHMRQNGSSSLFLG